jgi:hypothetical protein
MSPLRMRMIEDMKLAGLSPGTQATYKCPCCSEPTRHGATRIIEDVEQPKGLGRCRSFLSTRAGNTR